MNHAVTTADPADDRDNATTRTFIDFWDTETCGDLQSDFADAVDQARWCDDPEGGTLANKYKVTLITDEVMNGDEAVNLAKDLLAADDRRVTDPYGPAGAIRVPGEYSDDGWVFFGRAPVQPFPPCRDDLAAQIRGFRPRCEEWLPVATVAPAPCIPPDPL